MRKKINRLKQRVMAVLAAVAHPSAAPAGDARALSGKRRIRSVFCAVTAAVLVSAPALAYAGTPSITWTEVDQSVDSSGNYIWTDSKGTTHKDTDISQRLVPDSANRLVLIMNGALYEGLSNYRYHSIGANYDGYFYTADGYVAQTDEDGEAVTGVLYADPSNAPLLDSWESIDFGEKSKRWWFSFDNGRVVMTNNNTVLKNSNGWWYLKDGAVDFGYTGFGSNRNGEWYVVDGEVDFSTYGLYADDIGVLSADEDDIGALYYVVDGKVQEGMETDVVKVTGDDDAEDGWYHISNGKVLQYVDVAKNSKGWWYCDSDGKVDFNFNGIAENKNGWWYITGGKVDFSYTGTVTVDSDNKVASSGTTYTVTEGKVSK